MGAAGFIFFTLNSQLFRQELGASNPIATAQLTQGQKAELAQQNAAGDRVLYECTASQYWTEKCDRLILSMAQTCQESNNLPSYCKDARFTNYISQSGGKDGITKRMADREKRDSEIISNIHIVPESQNKPYHPPTQAELEERERANSPIKVEYLQDCLNTLPSGSDECTQKVDIVYSDCELRRVPPMGGGGGKADTEYLAQKCSLAEEYRQKTRLYFEEQIRTSTAKKVFLYVITHEDASNRLGLDNDKWREILSSMDTTRLDSVRIDKTDRNIVYLSRGDNQGQITVEATVPATIANICFVSEEGQYHGYVPCYP